MKRVLIVGAFFFCAFTMNAQKEWSVDIPSDAPYLIGYEDSSQTPSLYGYKDKQGNIVIPAKYNYLYTDTFVDMALVDSGNSPVAINRTDSIILHVFMFDNGADYPEEGLFRFVENGKIGFADLHGRKVIPAQFDFASPFSEGRADVNIGGHSVPDEDGEHSTQQGGKWGVINRKGKYIQPLH